MSCGPGLLLADGADQTLDAVKDPSGQVQFALAEQPA